MKLLRRASIAITSMLFTHFIMKVVDRIKNPPVFTREELHKEFEKAERYRKKLEADRIRRLDPKVNVRFESTPRSPDAWLGSIGTVGEFAAQYKENIPPPKEPCDHAALRPCSDLGLRAWGGDCNGSAMGVAR